MSGKQVKNYLDKRTARIRDQVKDDIEDVFDNESQFLQSAYEMFDGKSHLEAKVKMLEMRRQRHLNKVEEINSMIAGLKEQIEQQDPDDISTIVPRGDADTLEEHDQYEKAMQILKEKYRQNRNNLNPDMQPVRYWSQELGVKKSHLIDHVKDKIEGETQ